MKNLILSVALVLCVCLCGSFTNANRANVVNGLTNTNVAPLQGKVQPFCKFTYVDHRGHSVKLLTYAVHSTGKALTFIFDSGERLVINFTILRAGHFVADSPRSKDPQIQFYHAHGSQPVPMVGAVVITGTKPVSGNFSHLMSDDDDAHITLVAGSFSL